MNEEEAVRSISGRFEESLKSDWISISERLPPYKEVVMVWIESMGDGGLWVPRIGSGQLLREDENGKVWRGYWLGSIFENLSNLNITHWMPLPAPPPPATPKSDNSTDADGARNT